MKKIDILFGLDFDSDIQQFSILPDSSDRKMRDKYTRVTVLEVLNKGVLFFII